MNRIVPIRSTIVNNSFLRIRLIVLFENQKFNDSDQITQHNEFIFLSYKNMHISSALKSKLIKYATNINQNLCTRNL